MKFRGREYVWPQNIHQMFKNDDTARDNHQTKKFSEVLFIENLLFPQWNFMHKFNIQYRESRIV